MSENITEERLLTVDEMAAFLGIKVGALKDWTKLEESPCPCLRYKSRILRFEKEAVLEWFREQTKIWRKAEVSTTEDEECEDYED